MTLNRRDPQDVFRSLRLRDDTVSDAEAREALDEVLAAELIEADEAADDQAGG